MYLASSPLTSATTEWDVKCLSTEALITPLEWFQKVKYRTRIHYLSASNKTFYTTVEMEPL